MEDDELVITGTLIEGPDVNLVSLAGLQLSEEEWYAIWEKVSPRELLVEVLECEEIELEEMDGGPGLSDSRYEYLCGDRDEFIARLSDALLRLAGRTV
jgi:hypothetical protein